MIQKSGKEDQHLGLDFNMAFLENSLELSIFHSTNGDLSFSFKGAGFQHLIHYLQKKYIFFLQFSRARSTQETPVN